MEKEIKYKGVWTPEFTATRMLNMEPQSHALYVGYLQAFAYDIVDENLKQLQSDKQTLLEACQQALEIDNNWILSPEKRLNKIKSILKKVIKANT